MLTTKNPMSQAQKEPVKYLVLSGGGAKGVGYSGVYEALYKAGAMDAIEGLAGSSAGALSAAFIATGMSSESFQTLLQATNLRDLLGKKGIWMLNKDGTPLYELLDKTIKSNIHNFLNAHDIKSLLHNRNIALENEQQQTNSDIDNATKYHQDITNEINNLSRKIPLQKDKSDILAIQKQINIFLMEVKESQKNIERLNYKNAELQNNRIKIEALQSQDGPLDELKQKCLIPDGKILFRDLALMKLLAPNQFKDLYITATRKDNGELTIFSAQDTPEVEIALACRASASIPLVFQPVKIDGAEYVDGAYRDNTPYYHFKDAEIKSTIENITNHSDKIVESQKKGRTLAFVFLDDTSKLALYSAQENFYKPNLIKKFFIDICVKALTKVGGKFKYTQTLSNNYDTMRENSMHTIPLDTKGVGVLSFNDAQKKQDHLHNAAYIQTMDYLNHNELNKKHDHNIKYEGFFLEVYDQIDNSKLHGIWTHKVTMETNTKKALLLEFCTPQKWEGKNNREDRDKVIEEYILLASTSRTNGKLTTNTTTIDNLLSKLNDKKTSDKIKEDFVRILDKNPTEGKALHFSKKDIEKFINKQKDLPPYQNVGQQR